jgi:hypothetical protein
VTASPPRVQGVDRGIGIPRADGVGHARDRRAVAVDAVEHDDAPGRPRVRRPEDVAGRRRVRGPTMSPSTAPASMEVSWPGSPTSTSRASGRTASTRRAIKRQRHHRRLVHDHDVVRQAVGAVVAEPALAVRPPAEEAVQRRGVEREELGPDRGVHREARGLLVDRLLQARGGLPGRRGERDEQVRRAGRGGLLGQQRDDAGDRRRLARARAARDDREPPQDRGRRGERLAAVLLAGEEPPDAVGEHAGVHPRRRAGGQRAQVGRDLALLPPVAVEVQRRPDEPQRPVRGVGALPARDQPARRDPRHPGAGLRPRQRAQVDGIVAVHRGRPGDRREVDEHVPEPRRADGERRGQLDPRVAAAVERGEPPGDVDIGRREHARAVERPESPGASRARRTSC